MIFVISAIGKLQDWQGSLEMIRAKGLPAPDVLLSVAVGLELVGGILVILGLYARWGALALLLFIVPVTLIMHNFWTLDEGERRMGEMAHFFKNLALTGAIIFVLAMGAGPFSIDSLRQPKRPASPGDGV
jgi:putative oxidoreductase